jgi:hypothetical protein
MSAPVIDDTTSVLSFPQWQNWEHYFTATNTPYQWNINAGGFPTGMTFQPNWNGIGTSATGVISTGVDHGLALGQVVMFSSITWSGTGLAINTPYYVSTIPSAHELRVAATAGGASLSFTADFTVSNLFRPGYLTGAAVLPGLPKVTLQAVNASGPSAEVTFTIGIEAAAASPDSNVDLLWDFGTNDVIVQTSSSTNTTPADRDTPIIFVKEQDDLILRVRIVKTGTILDLGPLAEPTDLKLVIKELDPDGQVVVSDAAAQFGSGPSNSYLVHTKFNGDVLASTLANYLKDKGTFYGALAELEITFATPYGAFGPSTLRRTSKTFTIQIDRDLGEPAD